MRTSLRRTAKYDVKVGGMVLPGQTERFKYKVKRQVELEEMVRNIIGADINRVYYIIFAKELNKLKEKYPGDEVNIVADIIHRKWYARGLNNDKLNSIRQAMNLKTYTPPAPPNADFSGTPREGYAPLTVNFTDLSTGQITSWDWNFGDGSAHAHTQNPSHQYTNTGYFDVSLTVTGPGGSDTETKDDYIHVLSPEPWYDPAWNYRKKITIDHTKVSGTLTDFPVLISITDNDIKNHAKSDGRDFVITASDKTTKLKRELLGYDSSTGKLIIFVKVPSLSSSSDTILYLYYGNPSASETNDKDTWNTNYRMVLHMYGSTYSDIKDSTSNNNNVSAQGGSPLFNQNGKIYKSVYVDGVDDYLRVEHSSSLNFGGSGAPFTISLWYNRISTADQRLIISKQSSDSDGIKIATQQNGAWYATVQGTNSNSSSSFQLNTWKYMVWTYDGSAIRLYMDGILDSAASKIIGSKNPDTTYFLKIGGQAFSSSYLYNGYIEELRWQTGERSSGWILTEYNNQSDPSSFYSVGAEESKP